MALAVQGVCGAIFAFIGQSGYILDWLLGRDLLGKRFRVEPTHFLRPKPVLTVVQIYRPSVPLSKLAIRENGAIRLVLRFLRGDHLNVVTWIRIRLRVPIRIQFAIAR